LKNKGYSIKEVNVNKLADPIEGIPRVFISFKKTLFPCELKNKIKSGNELIKTY